MGQIDMRIFIGLLLLSLLLVAPVTASEQGVILLYHHVDTDTPPSTSISPTDFRRHLEYLRDNHFSVIALDSMMKSLEAGEALPDRAIAITFDDGYISIYQEAFPMLQNFGYPFTLFLSTGPINSRQTNYMNWDQVREMSDAGVLIANHLVEHPYMLERQSDETAEQWLQRQRDELLQAEQTILQETGQSHRYLAYPYGEYDPAIKALLDEQDFIGFAQNSGAVGFHSDFLALPRYPLASIYANLDTARTKFETLAFNVTIEQPESPVTEDRSPTVTLKFESGNFNRSQIGCFANSQPIPMNWLDEDEGLVQLVPVAQYGGRRWRYICTAPDLDSRRYYWFSVQWINLGE